MEELKTIMQKFAASGWDLIAVPAEEWLDGKADKDTLVSAIKQADKECGSCGCELDPLYMNILRWRSHPISWDRATGSVIGSQPSDGGSHELYHGSR